MKNSVSVGPVVNAHSDRTKIDRAAIGDLADEPEIEWRVTGPLGEIVRERTRDIPNFHRTAGMDLFCG